MRLPDGSDGFRDLLEAFVFGTLQELRDVQKNDEAALEFADAGNVAGFAFSKNGTGSFNVRRWNFQHFRGCVDNQAHEFILQLDDENAVLFVGLDFCLAKTLAQIHHRNDLAAKIDHPFDQVRSAGHGSDFRYADDFTHGADLYSVRFIADPKTDDLKILFHQTVSGPLRTRQFSVFEFFVALFFRPSLLTQSSTATRPQLFKRVKKKQPAAITQLTVAIRSVSTEPG